MNLLKILVLGIFTLQFVACNNAMDEQEIATIGMMSCRKPASFISKLGLNASQCSYSSSDLVFKGIVLIELPKNPQDTLVKKWQDSTWSKFGYMGPITTDELGNAYTAPIPFVNNLESTLQRVQNIYKIDNQTAAMTLFASLPAIDSVEGVTPFGILGLYYDCHGKKLYSSTVGGSTQENEKGVIYVIDIVSAQVVDKLAGYDAIGLFVGGHNRVKKLFFGHARSSEVYSVELTKDGKFDGKVKSELSLDGLGPRGTDRARRIRYDKTGHLLIAGIDFNYNLAAQTNKLETMYEFGYNSENNNWYLVK